MEPIEALPVGISNFELLRRSNKIYVDKTTRMIHALASGPAEGGS